MRIEYSNKQTMWDGQIPLVRVTQGFLGQTAAAFSSWDESAPRQAKALTVILLRKQLRAIIGRAKRAHAKASKR